MRNSWLTLLKNAVLARSSSASASARDCASSRARAAATAVPTCDAMADRNSRYAASSRSRELVRTVRRPTGLPPPGSLIGTMMVWSGASAAPSSERGSTFQCPSPARTLHAAPSSSETMSTSRLGRSSRFLARTSAEISQTSATVRALRVSAASNCVVLRRRSPITRGLVSVTVTSTPPTSPLSSRIGEYENTK